jgi:hypothetical protein
MFDHTKASIQSILSVYVDMTEKKITQYPSKRKKQWAILYYLHQYFDFDKHYSESDINDILRPWFVDYVRLRRDLIDFHFLTRKDDGSIYKKQIVNL